MDLSKRKVVTVVVSMMLAAVSLICGEARCEEATPEEIIEEYLKLPHPEDDMMGDARTVRWDVLQKLKATPDRSVEAIEIALKDINHRWQRHELASALCAFFKTEPAAEATCRLLEDKDYLVRCAAVHGLSRMPAHIKMIDGQPLLSYLIKASKDSTELVQIIALYDLAKSDEPEAKEAIRDRLKDQNSKVRFYAACFLTESGQAYGLDELKAKLHYLRNTDPDKDLRSNPEAHDDYYTDANKLLKCFERLTFESIGTMPRNAHMISDLRRWPAVAKQYETLLDAWSVWWGWDGEAAEKAVEKEGRTFTEILAEHSLGSLESLAVRSRPDVRGEIATEAFYDILKLRETGKAESATMLERVMLVTRLGYIMEENLYSGRIHGFAAAQALFCIGTKEAHELLAKYLLDDWYNVALGIRYAYHWEMEEPGRSRFIEKYHMRNRSDSLRVDLAVKAVEEGDEQQFEFTVSLKNVSDKPFCVLEQKMGYGDFLYFRDKNGKFVQMLETAMECDKMDSKWVEFTPGQVREYKTVLRVREFDGANKFFSRYLKEGQLWLEDEPSNAFFVKRPGKFKVYAMFQVRPLSEEQEKFARQKKFHKLDGVPWCGLAVSKPVKIEIESL